MKSDKINFNDLENQTLKNMKNLDKQVNYYLDTGMKLEVSKKIDQMVEDGSFNTIVNNELLYDLSDNMSGVTLDDGDKEYVDDDTFLPMKYMYIKKLKVFCLSNDMLNKPYTFRINKTPHISYHKIKHDGLQKIPMFNGTELWKMDGSYIRSFVNGRYIPLNIEYTKTPDKIYAIPKYSVHNGETMAIDITPYSYRLEYSMETIPENGIITFEQYYEFIKPYFLFDL